MEQVIVFKNEDNSICIIYPTAEVLGKYTMTEIAKKDVPAGLQYVIINKTDLPETRDFRSAWELPEDTKFDGTGSDSSTFKE